MFAEVFIFSKPVSMTVEQHQPERSVLCAPQAKAVAQSEWIYTL